MFVLVEWSSVGQSNMHCCHLIGNLLIN